jgi:hypothetical protein
MIWITHLVQLNRSTVRKNIKNKLNKIGFGTINTVWQGRTTLLKGRLIWVLMYTNLVVLETT